MTLLIYIAGPYTADTNQERDNNVHRARKVASNIWEAGHAAICPHLNNYDMEYDFIDKSWQEIFACFLVGDFEIISRCDGIIMLPGWEDSKGACAEFIFAKWLGLPIHFKT